MDVKDVRSVVKRHAFGVRSGVHNCISWLDESTLMYPVGKTIVLHHVATNSQRFLDASPQSTGVTALAVSANKKFVAVAEAGATPQIQIIDTMSRKRRKVLSVADLGSDRFVAMAFSADGRHLVTQGGAPGWVMHYWNWERSKPLASTSMAAAAAAAAAATSSSASSMAGGRRGSTSSTFVAAHAVPATSTTTTTRTLVGGASGGNNNNGSSNSGSIVSMATHGSRSLAATSLVRTVGICPKDPLLLSVSGVGFMRLYRYTDGLLQPQPSCGIPREQVEVFTTHTWLDGERVVAATQRASQMVLLTRGCYTGTLQLPTTMPAVRAGGGGFAALYNNNNNNNGGSTSNSHASGGGGHHVASAAVAAAMPATVTSIAPTHAGLVAATDRGSVCVYAYSDDDSHNAGYRLLHTLYVPEREAGEHHDGAADATTTAAAAAAHGDAAGALTAAASSPAHLSTTMTTASSEASMIVGGNSKQADIVGGGGGNSMSSNNSSTVTAPSLAATVAGVGASNSNNKMTAAGASATLTPPPHAAFVLDKSSTQSHHSLMQQQQQQQQPLERDVGAGGEAASHGRLSMSGSSQQHQQHQQQQSSSLSTSLAFAPPGTYHCPHAVTCMALDQFEERLAVVTACGRIYGVDFRQNWVGLAEANDMDEEEVVDHDARAAAATAMAMMTSSSSSSASTTTAAAAMTPTTMAAASASSRAHARRHRGSGLSAATATSSSSTLTLPRFESICQPFHTGTIHGMSCAVRKPLLMTSSADHSVRVWNVQTCRQDICVHYKLEPGAVALHPSGLMAVICFADRVRVMSVLWATLHDRCSISFRGAQDVQFASGGQYFAIAHGNLIDVFVSATCELHGQLRGHPQRIRSMTWCSTSPYPTDNRLVTCSTDGLVMNWSISGMHKDAEHCDKRYRYMAVASDDRFVWAVAAPTSATALDVQWKVLLREMDRHSLSAMQMQQPLPPSLSGGGTGGGAVTARGGGGGGGSSNNACEDYEFLDTGLSTLAVASHQRLLLAGSEDGALRAMSLPLQAGGTHEAPLAAHAADVTRIVVSFDETTLFTASSDGSIIMWDIREEGGGNGNARSRAAAAAATGGGVAAAAAAAAAATSSSSSASSAYTDEVLVTPQEMEERRLEMETLQQLIERLKTELDSEEKRRNHEQSTRVRERAEEHKSDAATVAAEYATLWNATAEQQRSFAAMRADAAAAAARAVEQLERTRQREVQACEQECATLQHTLEGDALRLAAEVRDAAAAASRAREAAAARFADVHAQRREALDKLQRQVARAQQTNAETLSQLAVDMDVEAQAMTSSQQHELQQLRERYLRMKGEGALARKGATAMAREMDVRAGEAVLLERAKAALRAQLEELMQRATQLHADMAERDAVIAGKERRLHALQRQKQELEKHKFVLDHRIRQLKAQTEPKQREMAEYHERLQAKDDALAALHKRNLALRGDVTALHDELAAQQQQTRQLSKAIKDFDTYKSRLQRDVAELAPAMQEAAQLRRALVQLYERHVVARGGVRIARADERIRDELAQQRVYLSASVQALQRKVNADARLHKAEMSARMLENMELIGEIHDLRQEMTQLRAQLASDDAAARRLRGPGGGGGGGCNSVPRSSSVYSNTSSSQQQQLQQQQQNKPSSHRISRSNSSGGNRTHRRDDRSDDGGDSVLPSMPYSTSALVGRAGVPAALHTAPQRSASMTSNNSSSSNTAGNDNNARHGADDKDADDDKDSSSTTSGSYAHSATPSTQPRYASGGDVRASTHGLRIGGVGSSSVGSTQGAHAAATTSLLQQQQQPPMQPRHRRSRASRSLAATDTSLTTVATTAATTAGGGGGAGSTAPRALERNRAQLRVQRAYVVALERALAEAMQRPSSMPPRLPALSTNASVDA